MFDDIDNQTLTNMLHVLDMKKECNICGNKRQ